MAVSLGRFNSLVRVYPLYLWPFFPALRGALLVYSCTYCSGVSLLVIQKPSWGLVLLWHVPHCTVTTLLSNMPLGLLRFSYSLSRIAEWCTSRLVSKWSYTVGIYSLDTSLTSFPGTSAGMLKLFIFCNYVYSPCKTSIEMHAQIFNIFWL